MLARPDEAAYDLALNVGSAAASTARSTRVRVVHVVSDCLAELGAEDDEAFLTAAELNLLGDDEFPFTRGRLVNARRRRMRRSAGCPPWRALR